MMSRLQHAMILILLVLPLGCAHSKSNVLVSFMANDKLHNMNVFEALTIKITNDGVMTKVIQTQDGRNRIKCGELPRNTMKNLKKLVEKAIAIDPQERYFDQGIGPQSNSSLYRELRLGDQFVAIEEGVDFPEELAKLMIFLSALPCSDTP